MGRSNPEAIERYKATLRREEMAWQARLELMRDSDRFAVAIGLVALRSAILMNAGAIVALLAFVGQLWTQADETLSTVLRSIIPFVAGLVFAGLATAIAYFYQSFVTAKRGRELENLSADNDKVAPPERWLQLTRPTALAMVGFVFLSHLLFIIGAVLAVQALTR